MLVISERVLEVIVGHCWSFLMDFEEMCFLLCLSNSFVVKKRPLKHNHNQLYSKISKTYIFEKDWILDVKVLFLNVVQVSSEGSFRNKVAVFQRGQARSRPVEKETHNICWWKMKKWWSGLKIENTEKWNDEEPKNWKGKDEACVASSES